MAEKIKILIAEDEPPILELTQRILADFGYDVLTATNGQEAVERVIQEKPDLVLLDVRMPRKDGFAVCRELRNDPELGGIPIIMVSALGDEYNRLNGFEEGADDYVSKPVSPPELKARIQALLFRSKGLRPGARHATASPGNSDGVTTDIERIATGIASLDETLQGGLPKGSNILVIGALGKGKSTFSRIFISTGVKRQEQCLYITLDDEPDMISNELSRALTEPIQNYEKLNIFQMVDAYSWTTSTVQTRWKYAVSGVLDLSQLAGIVADAGSELGQSIQKKMGGRRVLDSLTSLLVNFELGSVQRFLSSVARTALAFGGVTSLFVLEEGAVSDQQLNNVKYLMDGVLEFREEEGRHLVRVANMKWVSFNRDWVPWSP